jgi:hypothetical protein
MRRWIVGALALLLVIPGCTTMRGTAPQSGEAPTRLELHRGDTVRVLTMYRERHAFELTDKSPTGLIGRTVRLSREDKEPAGTLIEVPFSDLALVEVRRVDWASTAGVPLVVLFVAGAVVLGTAGAAVMPAVVP